MQSIDALIRPIRPDEVAQARWLIYTVARGLFHPEMTLEEATAYWDARGTLNDLEDAPQNYIENGGVFLVCEVGHGQMVGTGAFWRYAEGVCELRRLWFLPEYQRRRLGYAMLKELMRQAHTIGYHKMCLKTDPLAQSRAVSFYQQVGFVVVPHERAAKDELWMDIQL